MGPPGCAARQGLPKQCADPELLHRPGAAEREEKQPECPQLPSLRAEAGIGTALPRGDGHRGRTKPRGAGQRRCSALPWDHGPQQRDSPEGDDAEAAGPGEDKGVGVLAFLFSGIPGRPIRTAQHLQLAQGQAEVRAWGAATSAERVTGSVVEVAEPGGSPLHPPARGTATGAPSTRCWGRRAAPRLFLLWCRAGLGKKGSWAFAGLTWSWR